MKTIDVKSMLIGFLLCACGFLLTGSAPKEGRVGTFVRWDSNNEGVWEEGLLDTRNGDIYNAKWHTVDSFDKPEYYWVKTLPADK